MCKLKIEIYKCVDVQKSSPMLQYVTNSVTIWEILLTCVPDGHYCSAVLPHNMSVLQTGFLFRSMQPRKIRSKKNLDMNSSKDFFHEFLWISPLMNTSKAWGRTGEAISSKRYPPKLTFFQKYREILTVGENVSNKNYSSLNCRQRRFLTNFHNVSWNAGKRRFKMTQALWRKT